MTIKTPIVIRSDGIGLDGVFKLLIPVGSKILTGELADGVLHVWYAAPVGQVMSEFVEFEIASVFQSSVGELEYIASFQVNGEMRHLFQVFRSGTQRSLSQHSGGTVSDLERQKAQAFEVMSEQIKEIRAALRAYREGISDLLDPPTLARSFIDRCSDALGEDKQTPR